MTIPHLDIAKRWAMSRLQPQLSPAPYPESRSRRMVPDGDTLFSYGSHFPLVRLIRRRGKPSHWLVNGDTWGGGGWSMTGEHQRAVQQMVRDYRDNLGMPYVIVPQSVLDAAGIDTRSVQPVDVSEDWHEAREDVYTTFDPVLFQWQYEERLLPGTGGWFNTVTGQWLKSGHQPGGDYVSSPPGRPSYSDYITVSMVRETEQYKTEWEAYKRAERAWENEWREVPAIYRRTGRRILIWRREPWASEVQLEDRDGTLVYVRRWTRHWLGESLIRARVPYRSEIRCRTCQGTGTHPHSEALPGAEGPLTERQDAMWHRWQAHGTGPEPRNSIGSRLEERCADCLGRGRVAATLNRWAYFLSGFDHNEPRPSYFFTELPPKARPRTIAEAYEALKPATVRLAEEMGRTVLRQGDQFFIEMPGLSLRELKRHGGVHHRRGGEGRQKQQWEPDDPSRWHTRPRFQRYINENCWLHGTTHEATEVVRVGEVTYCRGMVRHVPDGRAPDHIRLGLGDRKTWFLSVPNTTPVGIR